MRPSKRAADEMRKVSFERGVARYAEGSCLVRFGETHVLVRGLARGQAAAVAARPGTRMGHGRICDVAARDADPHAARIVDRQSFRPHPGDSAPHRPVVARRRRPAAAWRAADHHRLRRAAGGRRHPHRLDHRRLDRAARLPPLDGAALDPAREPAQGSCRRRFLRHCRRRSGDRSRLCRGFRPPTPTPISS